MGAVPTVTATVHRDMQTTSEIGDLSNQDTLACPKLSHRYPE